MIEHIKVVDWFNETFPELSQDFHHFANERKCTPRQGYILKRMGVKRGVADFHLAYPSRGYHGLWIELKAAEGRLSPEQKGFIARKNELGYSATAQWGYEDTKNFILWYLEKENK